MTWNPRKTPPGTLEQMRLSQLAWVVELQSARNGSPGEDDTDPTAAGIVWMVELCVRLVYWWLGGVSSYLKLVQCRMYAGTSRVRKSDSTVHALHGQRLMQWFFVVMVPSTRIPMSKSIHVQPVLIKARPYMYKNVEALTGKQEHVWACMKEKGETTWTCRVCVI